MGGEPPSRGSFLVPFIWPWTERPGRRSVAAALKPLGRVGEVLVPSASIPPPAADPVDQLAGLQRAADAVRHLVEAAHRYGAASIGCGRPVFTQLGDVHVAEYVEHQRAAGSASRSAPAHHRFALVRQREPFAHAEAMLFVDHGERQRLEDHVVLISAWVPTGNRSRGFQPRRKFRDAPCPSRGRSGYATRMPRARPVARSS